MLDSLFNNPLFFIIWIGSLLFAISFHEAAHAFVADRLGDPTPRSQGRLTLNPLAHLAPLGTLMLLLVRFGWGRPVQFDPYNLKNPRRDAALISIAGPISNLLLAATASVVSQFLPGFLSPILYPFIFLNVGLAIFNLVPVHPLDGGKIIVGLLPLDLAVEWDSIMRRYGTIILILMILPLNNGASPIISLISPIVSFIVNLLLPNVALQ